MTIRQPIITIVGHVDHGKTTILDSIRSTAIAEKEAGGITQKISFTTFPTKYLEERARTLLEKLNIKVEIPGFLFIDTPGHAAFTNLRKRGGSLADLAILVIDINEGIMPQTAESIEILKANKTPFIVALNKIDVINGWKKFSDDLRENIERQSEYTRKDFENKLYKIIRALSEYGFDSDLYYRVSNFTKQLALVPCSGKKGEGITELLVMLAGLSQKFLKERLIVGKEARGTILELRTEKGVVYVEAILYDGILKVNDTIVVGGLDKAFVTRIRVLFEALPLAKGFKVVKQVNASAGIRMQILESEKVLAGMPFVSMKNLAQAAEEVQKEVSESLKLDKEGIIIKADSLGSLEALLFLLKKSGINVVKAGIGNINKSDVISASASLKSKPIDAVVLGFNVSIEEDVKQEEKVKLLVNDVIYRLIEDFEKWREEKEKELEREKLAELTLPCKIRTLKYVFRQSKPAIIGVRVEAGIMKAGIQLMNSNGEIIDKIKAIQSKNKTIESAKKNDEVAISLPNVTIGRQLKEDEILFSSLSEEEFRKLKENKKLLSQDEIAILQEIVRIKRKEKATWGL
ncbi:MAG: translation initiation factor IF-2 [Candidatus Pacearchaeota archaeon]